MTDEIFSVATQSDDVAALAQNYMNRADGERLLLPLPSSCKQGNGVRFVVYLADGTPAFAGAGLCVQVSDQGGTVPEEQRFETLLDTLQFDERSRPVYDYIVAVRNAAYSQPHEEAGEGDVLDADVDVGEGHEAAPDDGEPVAAVDEAELLPATDPPAGWDGAVSDGELSAVDGEPAQIGSWSQPEQPSAWSQPAGPDVWPQEAQSAEFEAPPPQPWNAPDAALPSFIPGPLPTGLLTRPARTTHWQPSPPRRPTPRPATGLFRYAPGGLPRPARPPYPDLDRSLWVQPAPRPSS
jgi:hypothetical protein